MKPIALQTYTLRDAMDADFCGTLQFIADTGYKGIETAGLYGRSPAEVAKAAADHGLTIVSNHGGLPTAESFSEILDLQKSLGSTRLVGGFGPDALKTVDDCKAAAGQLQAAAEMLAPHGISVHMHNHYWEFKAVEDGRFPFDIMLAEAPAIFSETDIYWVTFGGADPVDVFARYGKRVQLVHVKDGLVGGEYAFRALGEGDVDLPAALKAIDPAVTEWFIVEQDASDGDMKRDVKTSYDCLVSQGLALGNR